jgi:hypothetical protein
MSRPFIQLTISALENSPEGEMNASIQWGRLDDNGRSKVIDMEYFLNSVQVPKPNSKPYKQWVADVLNCVCLANHGKAYSRREAAQALLDARRHAGDSAE